MNYKTKQFDIKSMTDSGELTGYFSTYQTVADSYGDCVSAGCFKETIKEWNDKGKHIPLVWNHNMDDPEMIIGQVDKIEDDDYGPLMTAHFYDTPKARAARNLMQEGSVYQFSYAYSIDSARKPTAEEKAADPKINQVLDAVSLMEITITPTPAQPLAEMVSVKSDDMAQTDGKEAEPEMKEAEPEEKAGRRNSKADADKLEQAIALIQDVLGQTDDIEEEPEPEDGEDEEKANGAPEEPEQSNPKKDALLEVIAKIREEE